MKRKGIYLTELEQRLHELREQAKKFAAAEAERVYLEHFRKSKLAMLMKRVQQEQGLETVNAQEREALASTEYQQVLEGLRDATKIAEENRWLLRISMQGSSLWQTQEATKRAEMVAYNTPNN